MKVNFSIRFFRHSAIILFIALIPLTVGCNAKSTPLDQIEFIPKNATTFSITSFEPEFDDLTRNKFGSNDPDSSYLRRVPDLYYEFTKPEQLDIHVIISVYVPPKENNNEHIKNSYNSWIFTGMQNAPEYVKQKILEDWESKSYRGYKIAQKGETSISAVNTSTLLITDGENILREFLLTAKGDLKNIQSTDLFKSITNQIADNSFVLDYRLSCYEFQNIPGCQSESLGLSLKDEVTIKQTWVLSFESSDTASAVLEDIETHIELKEHLFSKQVDQNRNLIISRSHIDTVDFDLNSIR